MLPNMNPARGLSAIRSILRQAKLDLNFARNEVLDQRVTFSRTSNATRVNAQGLIEYAPHNLLTYSENFDNAVWTKTRSSITANVITAPDGTTTADKFIDDGSIVGQGYISQNYTYTAASPHVFSFYAKAGEVTSLRCYLVDSIGIVSASNAVVDLVSGTVTSGSAVVTNAGSGWYRIAVTGVPTAGAGSVRILQPTDTATTNGLYIWGAQLNIGSLQPYYTTSVKNLLGYSQNFENAAWAKSNSSVLTNLLTYSQEFDNAVWIKTNTTVTSNVTVSPNGTITAENYVATATSGEHTNDQSFTASVGNTYTGSCYVKADGLTDIGLRFTVASCWAGGISPQVRFNLTTQTASVISGTPVSYNISSEGNGWYRISMSVVCIADGTPSLRLQLTQGSANVFTGDGTSGIYLWGAQLVQGTNPEEYTVTTSAAAPIQVRGPLGFLGAEKLVEDIANITHFIQQNVTVAAGIPYTLSLYAKESQTSPKRYLTLLLPSAQFGSNKRATFDLATGTLTTVNSPATATMTTVGDGWWRCEISATAAVSGATGIGIRLFNAAVDTLNAYQGNGTSGIYIFGAQLSDSASLDPYSYNFGAAPTSTAYYGPRFDYDPVTLAPKGLLIEEARTNICQYSGDYTNWTLSEASTSGVFTTPTGSQSAIFLASTNALAHRINKTGLSVSTSSANVTYCYGAFIYKPEGSDVGRLNFRLRSASGNGQNIALDVTGSTTTTTFNFVASVPFGTTPPAAVTSSAITIQNYGNGVFRVSIASPASASTDNISQIDIGFGTNADTSAGTINTKIGVWGLSVEAGAFPTSYIPTTTAQVTRAADNASMTGTNFSSWYNQSEGTFVTSSIGSSVTGIIVSANNSTTAERVQVSYGSGSGGNINLTVTDGGVLQAQPLIGSITPTNLNKTAATYKLDDFALSVNGITPAIDTVGTIPAPDRLTIGMSGAGAIQINGHIQSFKYYPRRLANSDLQRLTR